ncbi:MAG: hypothetical protein RIR11_2052 [Bacteroidota bacterium]
MKRILRIRADCFKKIRLNPRDPFHPFCYHVLVLIHMGKCGRFRKRLHKYLKIKDKIIYLCGASTTQPPIRPDSPKHKPLGRRQHRNKCTIIHRS